MASDLLVTKETPQQAAKNTIDQMNQPLQNNGTQSVRSSNLPFCVFTDPILTGQLLLPFFHAL